MITSRTVMGKLFQFSFATIIFTIKLALAASSNTTEKSILDAITTNYDSNVRPIEDSRQPTEVKLDVKLSKIVKLDTKEQQLQTNVIILMRWSDTKLKWNKSK